MELLKAQWDRGHFVCVGLDSDDKQIPPEAQKGAAWVDVINFNIAIVEATRDTALAYKPNMGFYVELGPDGLVTLKRTIAYIHDVAPEIPVILDAKVADIGRTNEAYATGLFDEFGADAITVHNYLGVEAMTPFLAREDKGIIVLCRTSNKGAGEFQDLTVPAEEGYAPAEPLYMRVARNVMTKWNKRGNCGLVVGATYPEELGKVRVLVGNMPILIPGIGTQGGDVEKTVANGRDRNGQGMIINSSSGIIFAKPRGELERFDEAARRALLALHDQVESYRRPGLV